MNKYTATRYVIREKKEWGDYDYRDGEMCDSLGEANLYKFYQDALASLATFDQPEEFKIIRVFVTITEEEVM